MTHLVTGYKGEEHIKSEDQGSFNASFFGTGQFVMEAGSKLEASITSNNNVRVFDGDILMKGRHIRINPNTYEDMTITTGTAGVNRNDLIVMTYQKNGTDGTEDAFLEVIKGTETASTASDPAYTDGDILGGATLNQMPLYRVKLEGVVLSAIEPLFDVIPTYATLAEQYKQEFVKACESHLDSLNIYDTMEEIEANTQENQLAGALAVKELGGKVNQKTPYNIPKNFSFKDDSVPIGSTYIASAEDLSITSSPNHGYVSTFGESATRNATLLVSTHGTLPKVYVRTFNCKEFRRLTSYIELTGTLAAGETTITLTDDAITTDSTFSNPFTTIWGVSPTEAPVVTNGSITYTFDAQDVDMGVKVRVM